VFTHHKASGQNPAFRPWRLKALSIVVLVIEILLEKGPCRSKRVENIIPDITVREPLKE